MRDAVFAASLVAAFGAAAVLPAPGFAQTAAPPPAALADPAPDEAPPVMDEGAPVPTSPAATGALAPADPESAETIVETDPDLWIGKPILSADGVEIGSVEAVETDADGVPRSVTTSVGGFLGFGGSSVQLPVDPADFDGGEVRIGMVETDIDSLAAGGPDSPAEAGLATSADELRD